MRIRSIKPEFWRSDDISRLSISARLTFIGMWSYVDDNGVGSARLSNIIGDLYAEDMAVDPQETLRRVSSDLQQLETAGLILKYKDPEHPTRELYYVVNWERHQLVNRPSKGHQYPLPTAETLENSRKSAIAQPVLLSPSGDSPETPPTGAGEQGSRGTGEQGKKSAPAKAGGAAKSPASIEHEITDAAYQEVGKAFNFIAVRQIVKWAIHDRGEDPEKVKEAIVGVYSLGKPITKQTLGQWLDGHIRAGGRMDRRTETLLREMDQGGSALQIEEGFFS